MLKCIIQKTDLRALCFVLSVAVASLAVVVIKKNDKVKAFRVDLAEAAERISDLEAQLADKEAAVAIEDVQGALQYISSQTSNFEKELDSFMQDLDDLDVATKPVPEKW